MRVKDYLEGLSESTKVTFIIVEAKKDKHSPSHSTIYRTTPINMVREWKEIYEGFLDMIVVNNDYPPIDITGTWLNWYNNGQLKCCIIQSEECLRTLYSERQANDMIKFYEDNVK